MNISLKFAFLFAGLTSVAAAANFEVKGIETGMTLASLRKVMPQMQCQPWLTGPYEVMCDANTPSGSLATLADQPLVSIRVIADSNDVAHVIIFFVSCGLETERLLTSFRNKWGKPEYDDTRNVSALWRGASGDTLSIGKANGKDNICSVVTMEDAKAIESRTPRKYVPSKDL